jgi:hypothetical protein
MLSAPTWPPGEKHHLSFGAADPRSSCMVFSRELVKRGTEEKIDLVKWLSGISKQNMMKT